ncbi:PAS domain S-box protein [Pontibacter sp. SGAir0037]|uniref:PAS domain S-box protein n=1 Tax=Pontibacter sp. SGAir0037 TaxID=2571030 RepID=UPI0010CCD150|nr:PAS domain S-box protein [Pontibacter sp. SGAir0037]QCR22278.1 hypothetical protein C1N53_07965 [Pontibacter sp. SGAir0037]
MQSTNHIHLLEKLQYAILVTDADGIIRYVNDRFAQLFDLPQAPDSYPGSPTEAIEKKTLLAAVPTHSIHPSQALPSSPVAYTLQNGFVVEREALDASAVDLSDFGVTAGTIWLYRDATARFNQQRTMLTAPEQEEEHQYPVIRLSTEGGVTYANNAGQVLLQKVSIRRLETFRKLLLHRLQGGSSAEPGELEVYIAGRYYSLTYRLAQNESYFSLHLTDVTERRLAEQALQESRAMVHNITLTVPSIIYIYDVETDRFTYTNAHVSQVLGYEKKDLEAKAGINFHTIAFKEESQKLQEHLLRMKQASHDEVLEMELKVKNKAGEPRWLHCREAVYQRKDGDRVSLVIGSATDITAQKLQSQQLAQQKNFYESILNTVPIDVVVFDKELRYRYINHTAVKDKEVREWLIGKTTQDYGNFRGMAQQQIQNRIFYLEKAQCDKALVEFEDHFINKDAKEIVFLRRVCPVTDENGQIAFLISSGIDITEEKRTKSRLEESESLHRLLSENSKDAIGLHEPNGASIYLSNSFEEMFGIKANKMLGQSPFNNVHPEDRQRVTNTISEEVVKGKASVQVQYRGQTKNGDTIWLETDIKPILNNAGEVVKLQTATRDISQRLQTKEALINSEKKYRELIKHSHAYIMSHDMQGNILTVNPYLLEQLGFEEKDIIGRNLRQVLPDDSSSKVTDYLQRMEHEVAIESIIHVQNRQQERRSLLFRNYKVQEDGEPPYVIGIAQDITARLQLEEELKRAKQEAEESSRVKELFLANMSHEIRTPMNGIMGMAGLLEKTSLDRHQKDYLGIIRSSSENLLVIINDILDMAKIEAGKMELEQIPFSLSETVSASFNALQYRAEEKELQYVLRPMPDMHYALLGDPYRLNQVLLNLLNNAIKFTAKGSVELSMAITQETADEVTLQFSVKDTGIGIPETKLESIFEEFNQAFTNTTRQYGGTGLGLNICQRLLEMQDGRIWVTSRENQGSTFSFEITYPKSTEVLQSRSEEKPVFTSLSHLKLLLAEDNEVNIFLAVAILKGWGTSVDVATNGLQAYELASHNTYDLILMDIQMPELNGVEATRLIRQLPNPQQAQVPIIALTANAIKGDAEKYLTAGMDDYLSKPFDEQTLYRKINELLTARGGIVPASPEVGLVREKVNSHTSAHTEEPLYNLDLLHRMSRGNEAFINKTIQVFLNTVPGHVEKLNQFYKNSDWMGVSTEAHQLKPTLEVMGIQKLHHVIREIEQDAKEVVKAEELEKKIRYVAEVVQLVMQQLEKRI